jgi:4-amino-4-deoxy-L-arabinose transferase-like glycosyltransferase
MCPTNTCEPSPTGEHDRNGTAVGAAWPGNPEYAGSGAPSQRRANLWFLVLVLSAVFTAILLKLPSLDFPRDETDELIYWQLSKNLLRTGEYSLRGTEILPSLSPGMYDRPLFHHPPLYPVLLTPFVALDSPRYAVVVSWLGHVLCILAAAIVVRHAAARSQGRFSPLAILLWLPIVGVGADPVLTFVARKLWIDGILAGLIAISAALLLVADDGRFRRLLLLSSGVLLGLAALAKLSALALIPVYLWAVFLKYGRSRKAWEAVLLLSPACLLILPWLIVFYVKCGVILPSWVKPDAWLIEHNAFVKTLVNRSWYYYFLKTTILLPLLPFCLWQLAHEPRILKESNAKICLAWLAVYLAAMTTMGANGLGFQMRHVAGAMTPVYLLLLYNLTKGSQRPGLRVCYLLSIVFSAVAGAVYLVLPQFDEILSWWEICRAASL